MGHAVKLIEPDSNFKDEFEKFVIEYKKIGEMDYFDMYKKALEDFESYILELRNQSNGFDLPEGWVPSSTYWLTDEREILGVIRIRHSIENEYLQKYAGHIGYDISPKHRRKGYGTKILDEGLKKVKELGLKRVLITCVQDNIGSTKVIENNGGIFESEVYDDSIEKNIRRYWIELD